MSKKSFYKRINNFEEYQDFIDEVIKMCPYSVYINSKRVDKRKLVSEAAVDDAEDWFDNNIPVTYFAKNNMLIIYIGK